MTFMELKECTLTKKRLWKSYLILLSRAKCSINKLKGDLGISLEIDSFIMISIRRNWTNWVLLMRLLS